MSEKIKPLQAESDEMGFGAIHARRKAELEKKSDEADTSTETAEYTDHQRMVRNLIQRDEETLEDLVHSKNEAIEEENKTDIQTQINMRELRIKSLKAADELGKNGYLAEVKKFVDELKTSKTYMGIVEGDILDMGSKDGSVRVENINKDTQEITLAEVNPEDVGLTEDGKRLTQTLSFKEFLEAQNIIERVIKPVEDTNVLSDDVKPDSAGKTAVLKGDTVIRPAKSEPVSAEKTERESALNKKLQEKGLTPEDWSSMSSQWKEAVRRARSAESVEDKQREWLSAVRSLARMGQLGFRMNKDRGAKLIAELTQNVDTFLDVKNKENNIAGAMQYLSYVKVATRENVPLSDEQQKHLESEFMDQYVVAKVPSALTLSRLYAQAKFLKLNIGVAPFAENKLVPLVNEEQSRYNNSSKAAQRMALIQARLKYIDVDSAKGGDAAAHESKRNTIIDSALQKLQAASKWEEFSRLGALYSRYFKGKVNVDVTKLDGHIGVLRNEKKWNELMQYAENVYTLKQKNPNETPEPLVFEHENDLKDGAVAGGEVAGEAEQTGRENIVKNASPDAGIHTVTEKTVDEHTAAGTLIPRVASAEEVQAAKQIQEQRRQAKTLIEGVLNEEYRFLDDDIDAIKSVDIGLSSSDDTNAQHFLHNLEHQMQYMHVVKNESLNKGNLLYRAGAFVKRVTDRWDAFNEVFGPATAFKSLFSWKKTDELMAATTRNAVAKIQKASTFMKGRQRLQYETLIEWFENGAEQAGPEIPSAEEGSDQGEQESAPQKESAGKTFSYTATLKQDPKTVIYDTIAARSVSKARRSLRAKGYDIISIEEKKK